MDRTEPMTALRRLTDREWEIIRAVILEGWAEGISSRDIMATIERNHPLVKKRVGVSAGTMNGYVKRIYDEVGLSGQAAAVTHAYRVGWLRCPCRDAQIAATVC